MIASTWFGRPMSEPITRRSSANCCGRRAMEQPVEQRLRTAHRVGAAPGDVAGQCHRVVVRRLGQAGGDADRVRLAAVEHAGGERELLGHVGAHQLRQHERAGHVGHQAPVHLAHAQLRVGVHDADVGAQRDLDAAAECVAVHRSDDRDRHLLPHPRHLLAEVGDPALGHGARVAAVAGVIRSRPLDRSHRTWPGTNRSRGRRRTNRRRR